MRVTASGGKSIGPRSSPRGGLRLPTKEASFKFLHGQSCRHFFKERGTNVSQGEARDLQFKRQWEKKTMMNRVTVLVLTLVATGVTAEWKRESVETGATTSTFVDRSGLPCESVKTPRADQGLSFVKALEGPIPVTLVGRECDPAEAGGPYVSLLQFDPMVFNTSTLGVADAQLKLYLER
eukprot:7052461-Pyramimonas_sp.AAC.1